MPLKNKIKKSFSNSALSYNKYAIIQKIVGQELSEIADGYIRESDYILDLGCGTGFLGDKILEKKKVKFFASDISQNMLNQVSDKQIKVNCDFENLTFENNKFDMVVSSFSLQWSFDLLKVFNETNRVLKDGAMFIFSVPLKESLQELKNLGVNSINKFSDSRSVIRSLNLANFEKQHYQERIIRQRYQNPLALLKNIKNIGANLVIDNNDNRNSLISLRHHGNFEEYWKIGYFVFKKIITC
ncbi:MAG: methyltransferase domain-containing protein [Rickettsiales bacterium]|nr:methyltransferase domain-containing protein [Rickettsiales bacterium]